MRAALYARFSTDKQREASIEDQFREATRVGASAGLDIVARFSDSGISAGTAHRPGYQAMLDAARRHEFEVIVVEDISRLWRNRAEFGVRSAELEDLNVHIITAVGDDTRRDGYGLVLGIKSAIAEHQRREISYRTRRGMEGLARSGKSTGGRLFGYGSEAEADTVRRVFRERVAGLEFREVAAGLNRDGIASPRGKRWDATAVKRLVANPRYAGRLTWGLTVSRRAAQDSRSRRVIRRPGGPLVERAVPALVDPLIWGLANPQAPAYSAPIAG